MKYVKYIIFLFFLPTLLYGYIDSDFDGVDDKEDKCPNTPLSDLVDTSGCTIESLISYHHYSIFSGLAYMDSNYQTLSKTKTYIASFEAYYYYKNFLADFQTSYYNSDTSTSDDNGLGDSYINISYRYYLNSNLYIAPTLGIVLPTYDNGLNNNNLDYYLAASLDYQYNQIDLYAGYGYTIINDDDYNDENFSINYQDTSSYYFGFGYDFQKLYTTLSYNFTNSIYKDVEDIETLMFLINYQLENGIYLNSSYAYGLSDSAADNYISIKIGWMF